MRVTKYDKTNEMSNDLKSNNATTIYETTDDKSPIGPTTNVI